MSSKILREIFKTLVHYETLPCDTGTNTFTMLDGQTTRFELTFMEYINYPYHLRVFCIGVSYGDSAEHHGEYKIAFSKAK